MIAFNNEHHKTTWQSDFVAMLPQIQQKLRLAFCRLDPEACEDAIAEGVVHSLLAYVRLHEQGRVVVATPSSLAWYSSRHVKRGRPAGGRMNGKEPLSRYGQISNDIEVERQPGNWIDAIVEDKRAPVADQVAAKMDVGAWFATLTKRMKEIAKDLAFGCSTTTVGYEHAMAWHSTPESAIDLHSFLSGLGPEFTGSRARGISDSGTIVGTAWDGQYTYAVLWTPVPEPAVLVLAAVLWLVRRGRGLRGVEVVLLGGVFSGFVATLGKTVILRVQTVLASLDFAFDSGNLLTLGCVVGIAVAGGLSIYLVQAAHVSNRPEVVVAGLTVVDPFVAVVLGITILGEAAGAPPWAFVVFALAGATAIAGVIALSRAEATRSTPPEL